VVAFCLKIEKIIQLGPYYQSTDVGVASETILINIYHFKEGKMIIQDRMFDRFKIYEDLI
jgi:hypothetical protein